ncbi:MAG: cyclic nucleotide-binding domain-containing protein [Deltaproteobacteria bacterium]|nr:cyclic nucleotide-binding domain-containing protein [Deltaproteobacteria bacterium]
MSTAAAAHSTHERKTVALRGSAIDWVLREVFSLRRTDRPVLGQLSPLFAIVTAASVIVATFTKTAFLQTHEVKTLPLMFLGSSAFTAVLSIVWVAVVERLDLQRRFLTLLMTAIGSFAALHLLYPLSPKTMALAQLVWCTGLSQLILVQTWNMSSAVLPSRQAKRLFPVLAAVSTLGAALGGGALTLGLKVVEAQHMMWFVILLLLYPLAQVRKIIKALQWSGDERDTAAEAQLNNLAVRALSRKEKQEQAAAAAATKKPFDDIARGFRTITDTPLLLRLAGLVFLLQVASLIIDFQFSTEMKLKYANRNEMASFLGTYYWVANSFAFFVALTASGRIVRVVGIGVAISASAIFVAVGSAAYFTAGRLGLGSPFWAIVATSFLERIFQFALTRNAMQMLVAPLDSKKGERAKTLIDGVVYRVATMGTSVVLLFIGATSEKLALLSPVTIVACIGVVFIGLSMNPHYRKALFEGLRARRVDSDVDPQTRALLQRSATGEVQQRLASNDRRDVLSALDIVRESKLPVRVEDLLPIARSHDPDLARRALELMNELQLKPERALLVGLMQKDRPPSILREALRLLDQYQDPGLLPLVSGYVQHPDLGVARLAVIWVQRVGGVEHAAKLNQKLKDDLQSPQAERRARAAYISGGYVLDPEIDLVRMVQDPAADVRVNAVVSMGQIGAMEYIDPLVDCLGRGELVPAASAALTRYGGSLVAALRDRHRRKPLNVAIQLRLLRIVERFGTKAAVAHQMDQVDSPVTVVRNNAIQSLWRMARDPEAPKPPTEWIRAKVLVEIETLRLLQRIELVGRGASPRHLFFGSELHSLRLQAERRSFRLLGLLDARAAMHRAYLHYRSPQQRVRSNAVELLDQHLTDEELRPFVGLVERGDGGTTGGDSTSTGDDGADMPALLGGADPWLVRVWRWTEAQGGKRMTRDPMDMVFLLKAVPLLSDLSGEQLLPVTDILQPVHVEAGDLVFAEGQPGNHLYVILEGEVDVLRGDEPVARLGVKECFGEMALLDQSPRSASVRARVDCELLAISRDDFQDLLDMHPALARGVIRVLTQRLRVATEQKADDK